MEARDDGVVVGAEFVNGVLIKPGRHYTREEWNRKQRAEDGVEPLTITLARRMDGGLRVYSDDLPGLILSGSDPVKVMADVWQAIQALLSYKADSK